MKMLRLICDGSRVAIIVANITAIVKMDNGRAIIYTMGGTVGWMVDESYDEVLGMLA